MNRQLIKEVSDDEIYSAIKQLGPLKAPEKDGFQGFFYRKYWHIVGVLIISPQQGAFIPGRLIQDAIVVEHECFHYHDNKKKGYKCFMALKFDLNKALDRVEWDFLIAILEKMGFSHSFVHWIKQCISTSSLDIMLNDDQLKGSQNIVVLEFYSSRERCSIGWYEMVGRDGFSINFWCNKWFPSTPDFFIPEAKGHFPNNFCVFHFIKNGIWDLEKLGSIVSASIVHAISLIPISRTGAHDKLVWHHTINGLYYVKSGYYVACELLKHPVVPAAAASSSSSVWLACSLSLQPSLDSSTTICFLLQSIIAQAASKKIARGLLSTFAFTSWAIWKSRNAHIFEDMPLSPHLTHSLNQSISCEYATLFCHPAIDPPNPTTNSQRSSSPPAQYVKYNCDGSFKDGKASIGILGRNNLGTLIDGHGSLVNA
ncbi:hypothetical protein POM88_024085 [Heracleum sosnowskyi]|uniref:Uncharacterized protein n=1 Tax=Heracleum sosnowskyi TaxID=360622 RepID=A0AAD8ILX7_9APIA|nr:hypothetical protein POM88_024085 [Heracleum sosnowskyi]